MRPSVHRRRAATLAVSAAGLTTLLSASVAPAATAAPAVDRPAAAVTSVPVTGSDSWFVDPRTPSERRSEIAVPRDPKRYDGRVRETRAVYRTRAGDLAVPVRYAFGHSVEVGQALTLSKKNLFVVDADELTAEASRQLRLLAVALTDASSIRCEGYTDYAGAATRNRELARGRAAAVCSALAARNGIDDATVVTYGPTRPAVVGGSSRDRRLNGRVVVQVTGVRSPLPPATTPGEPTEVHAAADGTTVTVSFAAPASDGGTPVTGYQVRVDDGEWVPVTLAGEGTSFVLTDQPVGSHSYQVRAVNDRGVSPASGASTVEIVAVQPDAPTIVYFGYHSMLASWMVIFEAGEANGSTVTGWEASVDGGPWIPATELLPDGRTARFACSSGSCGWSYSTPVRLRAVTATGWSTPSEAFVHDEF